VRRRRQQPQGRRRRCCLHRCAPSPLPRTPPLSLLLSCLCFNLLAFCYANHVPLLISVESCVDNISLTGTICILLRAETIHPINYIAMLCNPT
jgi:hypothetical protein